MAYTFTAHEIADASELNSLLSPKLTQCGLVLMTPVANTPTSQRVTFPRPFPTPPRVFTTPVTIYPGSAVRNTSVTNVTVDGFTVWIYRTTTAATSVNWQAWGTAPGSFTNGGYAAASVLNGGVGLGVRAGSVSITPTAGTATSGTVTFGTAFSATPTVVLIPSSILVGTTVDAWSVSTVTATGFKAWIRRSTSAATPMLWVAMGSA